MPTSARCVLEMRHRREPCTEPISLNSLKTLTHRTKRNACCSGGPPFIAAPMKSTGRAAGRSMSIHPLRYFRDDAAVVSCNLDVIVPCRAGRIPLLARCHAEEHIEPIEGGHDVIEGSYRRGGMVYKREKVRDANEKVEDGRGDETVGESP